MAFAAHKSSKQSQFICSSIPLTVPLSNWKIPSVSPFAKCSYSVESSSHFWLNFLPVYSSSSRISDIVISPSISNFNMPSLSKSSKSYAQLYLPPRFSIATKSVISVPTTATPAA